jgi:ferredoxin
MREDMPGKNSQRNANSIMEIKIDYKKCISCGKCVESCSMGAIEFFEETVVVASKHAPQAR